MKLIVLIMFILVAGGCTAEDNTRQPEISEELEDNENRASQIETDDEEMDSEETEQVVDSQIVEETIDFEELKASIVEEFEAATPTVWGENVEGVVTQIDTRDKVVALTFDACDGTPDSYDEALIDFLIEEEIPATLFINAQWIEENTDIFTTLADNPLFEIANHGYYHKPLSTEGESAYGIMGTENVEEVFDEIYKNQKLIQDITNETPNYFRSGTAYYDDVAVEIIESLGLKAVNYNVLGDAGGTFNESQIVSSFKTAKEGSIFLFHMNKPQSDISSGVKEGVQMLRDKGYDFVQLGEYDDHL